MKKLILAAIVMVAINSGVSAQVKNPNPAPGTNKRSPGYVDNNKNGVCDNYENNTRQYLGRTQGQGRRGGGCGMGNRQGCGNMPCGQGGNGRGPALPGPRIRFNSLPGNLTQLPTLSL